MCQHTHVQAGAGNTWKPPSGFEKTQSEGLPYTACASARTCTCVYWRRQAQVRRGIYPRRQRLKDDSGYDII